MYNGTHVQLYVSKFKLNVRRSCRYILYVCLLDDFVLLAFFVYLSLSAQSHVHMLSLSFSAEELNHIFCVCVNMEYEHAARSNWRPAILLSLSTAKHPGRKQIKPHIYR